MKSRFLKVGSASESREGAFKKKKNTDGAWDPSQTESIRTPECEGRDDQQKGNFNGMERGKHYSDLYQ